MKKDSLSKIIKKLQHNRLVLFLVGLPKKMLPYFIYKCLSGLLSTWIIGVIFYTFILSLCFLAVVLALFLFINRDGTGSNLTAGLSHQIKNDLVEIKTNLNISIEQPDSKEFVVEQIPTSEMVHGLYGDYFRISFKTLKDSQYENFYFKSGMYYEQTFEDSLLESVNTFKKEVMQSSEYKGTRIFVKGMSDNLDPDFVKSIKYSFGCPKEDQEKDPKEYIKSILYHPKKDNNANSDGEIYLPITRTYSINSTYNNIDLHFLRARFMQCKLQSLFPNTPIEIIEGDVAPEIDPSKRRVTMILYVPQ